MVMGAWQLRRLASSDARAVSRERSIVPGRPLLDGARPGLIDVVRRRRNGFRWVLIHRTVDVGRKGSVGHAVCRVNAANACRSHAWRHVVRRLGGWEGCDVRASRKSHHDLLGCHDWPVVQWTGSLARVPEGGLLRLSHSTLR